MGRPLQPRRRQRPRSVSGRHPDAWSSRCRQLPTSAMVPILMPMTMLIFL